MTQKHNKKEIDTHRDSGRRRELGGERKERVKAREREREIH